MKKIKLLIVTIFTLLCSSTNIEAYAETVSTAPNGCETPTVKYDSECPTNYYSSLSGKKKDDLLESLATLTFNNHKYYNTYGELRGSNCYSDADPNNSNSKLIDFYTGWSFDNDWITSSDAGYNRSLAWEREHVWPKSLSANLFKDVSNSDKGAGSDIHHLRPEIGSLNGSRSNKPFAEVDHSSSNIFYYTNPNTNEKIDTGCYSTTEYFEPRNESKGDVARILMYLYMHYSTEVSANVTNNKTASNDETIAYKAGELDISDIVGNVSDSEDQKAWDMLLKWNELDPVDTFEMNRNNYCASVTGTRNPFIDHPEYADIIWSTSYSGLGADGGVGGVTNDNTGGNEGDSDTPSSELVEKESYTTTYTVDSTSSVTTSGTKLESSNESFKSTYSNKYQLTSGKTATLTISGLDGYTVTDIELSMKSNTSSGAFKVEVYSGSTSLGQSLDQSFSLHYGSYSTSYVPINITKLIPDFNSSYTIKNNEDYKIVITSSENSVYIQSYTITYKSYGTVEEDNYESKLPDLLNSFYNSGTYTKKTNVNISSNTAFDLSSVFRGNVRLDRTTYYRPNELLMCEYDGDYVGYNSGYGTDSEGNLTHFKVDESGNKINESFAADKSHSYWNDTSKDGMEGFYVTLNDMLEDNYFKNWSFTSSTAIYEVEGKLSQDKYVQDFLAFTAPCLEPVVLNNTYATYFDISKLEVTNGTNDIYGEYLSLRIYVNSTNSGLVSNSECILSEARIYKGNKVFDETKMYSVNVIRPSNGSITSSSNDTYYALGDTIEFTVSSNKGYIIKNVVVNNKNVSLDSNNKFVLTVEGNTTVSAVIEQESPQLVEKNYTYSFSSQQYTGNETKELNAVNWTLEGNGGNYWGYDKTKGQQFGSGSAPYKTMTLSTSSIKGKITKIVIDTSGAKDINGTCKVTVGGVQIGQTISLTNTATSYTLTTSTPLEGDIVISYSQSSSKALYIKSISIDYLA